jgi:hypothetical protein
MPAFGRFPEEAGIIGRLFAGYGEIEWGLHLCSGEALQGDADMRTTNQSTAAQTSGCMF